MTESFLVSANAAPREADRRESQLVEQYHDLRREQGAVLVRHKLRPPGERALFTDRFDKTRNLLIEAKGSVTRESIRMAIGQLLDYQRFIEPKPHLAVLLTSRPREDLIGLLRSQEIVIIFRDGDGFTEM